MKRNRRPDWRRIKSLRNFTYEEAARTLGVHRQTVRHWVSDQGLPAITDQRPILIVGSDLIAFLKKRRVAGKRRCGAGEMYCLKCRQPRRPVEGLIEYVPATASRGTLSAICPACTTLMWRFVSASRLREVERQFGVSLRPPHERLDDTARPSLSCHLVDED
ncbi:MAG: helix-turn-helix domain-containing protein [Bauldia sp.]